MANSLNMELEDRYVVLKQGALRSEYHALTERIVLVTGGFGASSYTEGTALMVEFVVDGDTGRFAGWDVERLATEDEVEDAREEARRRG